MYATRLKMITATQMTGAQFASTGAGEDEPGKQLMTTTRAEYATATALMGRPNRPRLHRACGRSSPLSRRRSTQPMESMYVDMSARRESEAMILNARLEPRETSEMMIEIKVER